VRRDPDLFQRDWECQFAWSFRGVNKLFCNLSPGAANSSTCNNMFSDGPNILTSFYTLNYISQELWWHVSPTTLLLFLRVSPKLCFIQHHTAWSTLEVVLDFKTSPWNTPYSSFHLLKLSNQALQGHQWWLLTWHAGGRYLVTHLEICLMKSSGALPSLAEWELNLRKPPSGVNWLSIKEICQIGHHSSELLSAATQSVWRDSLLYLQEILKALMQLSKRTPKLSKTYSTTALLTVTSLLHEVCTCVSSLSDGHCKEH